LGGIAAQEVLKISGKFHPIFQWFYHDVFESLPETIDTTTHALSGSRYDGQIAVYGNEVQQKLENQKTFLVGAGALGCEFLKNFALMGISCGADGDLFVTDMDNIEKSNLNRQFLFRDRNIGQMKSTAAAEAVKVMNPSLKVRTSVIPVGIDTEDTFNKDFWTGSDIVVNALDNIKARLYVDSQCVLFDRPLFESGTTRTKANTQVIVPGKTVSYGSSQDPPEKFVPFPLSFFSSFFYLIFDLKLTLQSIN
jgi:ubiquitin-activating enzyme E1